jgi:PAS domain-containing protein
LLRNYDALVESQHALLNQSVSKMAKIPPADEIASTFSRFQLLKDSELEDMRRFLEEHKTLMAGQYREFEHERRSFEDMNAKMEAEKLRVSEERERIEAEVRRIRELNKEMTQTLQSSSHRGGSHK